MLYGACLRGQASCFAKLKDGALQSWLHSYCATRIKYCAAGIMRMILAKDNIL